MNLFISPIFGFGMLSFFSDDGIVCESISLNRNQGFADVLFGNENWEKTKSIFFVTGPASFTVLRNMAVFLETLQMFSLHRYAFYSLSTADYLSFAYNETDVQLLSVGKRECFVFRQDSEKKKGYVKYKNTDLSVAAFFPSVIGGRELISENTKTNISVEVRGAIDISQILKKILGKKEFFKSDSVKIDYGAEPCIG